MLKVFGNLVLVVSLFLLVGGTGGAVFVFALMGQPPICRIADNRFKEAEEAVRKYQAAKGTQNEARAQTEADSAMKAAKSAGDSCADANAYYRRNGVILSVVGFLGLIGSLFGAVLVI